MRAGAICLITVGAGLSVLLAYGVGWGLSRFLPFSTFEASLLSLLGVLGSALALVLVVRTVITESLVSTSQDDEGDEWDFEDEWEDEWEGDFEEEPPAKPQPATGDYIPGIPRWRQSPKQPDFSQARRNDPCPCGSGRKYKHCHGAKSGG